MPPQHEHLLRERAHVRREWIGGEVVHPMVQKDADAIAACPAPEEPDGAEQPAVIDPEVNERLEGVNETRLPGGGPGISPLQLPPLTNARPRPRAAGRGQ